MRLENLAKDSDKDYIYWPNRVDVINKKILEHCLISHLSSEPGHKGIIFKLKKEPILDLNMKLGEASGGAVAALIVKAALVTHNKMATFSEAGVSKKN